MRIPTLAVHFGREKSFSFDKETHLFPIAGLVEAELNRQGKSHSGNGISTPATESSRTENSPFHPLKTPLERHHPYIVEIIAAEAGCSAEDILDFEMVLYDTQPSCIGGLNNELIFSARLDNLGMTYCAVQGIIESCSSPSSLDNESTIRLIACFDDEEIGSVTAQGAESNLIPSMVTRLSILPGEKGVSVSSAYDQSLSTSFLISADMAHSVNPNYAGNYESQHRPIMNGGPVIKINANARYTTNSPGIVLLQELARKKSIPLQLFVVTNESSCGSTIGPGLAAKLGTRALDLGNPQLSMHSIRETGGVYDVEYGIKLFESFFENYSEMGSKILVDV